MNRRHIVIGVTRAVISALALAATIFATTLLKGDAKEAVIVTAFGVSMFSVGWVFGGWID